MFYGSRVLENKIDEFLDRISEAGLIYKKAIHVFLEHGVTEDFVTHAEQIGHIESRADELRREIETGLYEQNLIPDLRADVLSLTMPAATALRLNSRFSPRPCIPMFWRLLIPSQTVSSRLPLRAGPFSATSTPAAITFTKFAFMKAKRIVSVRK